MLTLDNIYKALYVLKEVIRCTDLIEAPQIKLKIACFWFSTKKRAYGR